MKQFFFCILAPFILCSKLRAADTHDYSSPFNGSAASYVTGGDTRNTYAVTVTSNPCVQLRAAVTNRSRRKICVQNQGGVLVSISTSTVLNDGYASGKFLLGESTNTALSPTYCTNSSSQLDACALAGAASVTVGVLEETQSIP